MRDVFDGVNLHTSQLGLCNDHLTWKDTPDALTTDMAGQRAGCPDINKRTDVFRMAYWQQCATISAVTSEPLSKVAY